MCGILGILSSSPDQLDEGTLQRMSDTLLHRGPDAEGCWTDKNAGIALAHRRLAIVDLSSAGKQPMVSQTGRFVITYNGEIYNHLTLRVMLAGATDAAYRWRGHSDTETLLAGFERWGVEETIKKCIGMFAFGVWDRQEQKLILGRDRLGEKPLYYGWQGSSFLFGSELKALRRHPSFQATVDRGALSLFLRHGYIPAPYSIFEGIKKLKPGYLISLSLKNPDPRLTTYWSGTQIVESGIQEGFSGTASEAVDQLELVLKDAVAKQLMADVPLGAFLSGGVDSTTIVALMQSVASSPVKTFTIGFSETEYNEAVYAKAVAKHLGTDHTELYVGPRESLAVISRLPQLYDEPFSDSSQIPTFLVAELARRYVTVSLSGDGGDELFCGYNRYQMTSALWGKLSLMPMSLRKLVAHGLLSISPQTWDRISRLLPDGMTLSNVGDKLHKGAEALTCQSAGQLYQRLTSHWEDPISVVKGGHEPMTILNGAESELPGLGEIQRMMALDMLVYLPDDILVKVDRAAMGVSLETRVPFLDHRVVEFAWHLPQSLKLREGQSKWALRQVLYRYVPKELIERPKMGFGVPLDRWLRGPLRDWAESLLEPSRLNREGYFHTTPIRQRWAEHLSGRRNWAYHLWDVLMFQAWLEASNA